MGCGAELEARIGYASVVVDELPANKSAPTELLARDLKGDVRCARCRYNLRGLSVRGVCPECGTPVRGTLLAIIDPAASEFQPLFLPGLAALLLTLWAWGALLAALSVLALRLNELAWLMGLGELSESPAWRVAPAALAAVSGVGALSHVRPHRMIPLWQSGLAALGVCAYVPLGIALYQIHAAIDPVLPHPYADPMMATDARTWWRLAASACAAAAIVGVRPNARLMVSRCMLMRTGRVDRQTLLVIVGALGLAMLGDVLHLASSQLGEGGEVLRPIGTTLIGVGSLLVLLGLVGVVIDAWRIRYAMVTPPLSLSDVLEDEPAAGGAA